MAHVVEDGTRGVMLLVDQRRTEDVECGQRTGKTMPDGYKESMVKKK